MSKLVWGGAGQRRYESGLDRGVLYPSNLSVGVPWIGLTNVSSKPDGGSSSPLYQDGVKYYNYVSPMDAAINLEAFSYPDAFAVCEGLEMDTSGLGFTGQDRIPFDLSYRTLIGNDLNSDLGYKIHLIYNCLVEASEEKFDTQSEDVDPETFSWSISTTPVAFANKRPTAHMIVDTTRADPQVIRDLEAVIYGTDETEARMPKLEELVSIMHPPTYTLNPDLVNGGARLYPGEPGDLRGDIAGGVYSLTSRTRLRQAAQPGLYILES